MDEFFQVFMLVILTVGILGLPAYFWLNARKKRLLAEYEEEQKNKNAQPDSENKTEKKDWRI